MSCVFNYINDNTTLSSDMPDDFAPFTQHISHLTLGISNLTTLPLDTFSLLPNLNSLSSRVDIQSLTQRQFKNASKLINLDIGYNNNLMKLEARLFKYAPLLQSIDLSFNQISEIEDRTFRGLFRLKYLSLDSNLLTKIKNKTFSGLRSLQRLDLSKNIIEELESGAFARFINLKVLQLNLNRISRLQSGIFRGFRSIQRIDLSVNGLNNVEEGVFDGLPTLQILELGFNQLITLADGFFDGMRNLRSLFMASNQIEEIEPGLANLTRLRLLDLSYNPLKHIAPTLLAKMDQLDSLELRSCNLTSLDNDTFHNKMELTVLDLSENDLSTIDWNIFQPLQKLKFLKLEANHIGEMENYTDIKAFLPNLQFINLQRNEIDCDTVGEMIEYFQNNTIEYEFGEEVDVGCRLLPIQSRALQAYRLSNAKFNKEALRLVHFHQ